jgi:hypothetical protein
MIKSRIINAHNVNMSLVTQNFLLGTEKRVKGNAKYQVSPNIGRRTRAHKTLRKVLILLTICFSTNKYFTTTKIRVLPTCNRIVHFLYVFAKSALQVEHKKPFRLGNPSFINLPIM